MPPPPIIIVGGGGRYRDDDPAYREPNAAETESEVWGYNPSPYGDVRYSTSAYKGKAKAWDRSWRQFQKFDWLAVRDAKPNLFKMTHYENPYGRDFSYRPLSVGNYLDTRFAADAFMIRNEASLGLPDDYGPYRWVRYYDDAVLVDMRAGKVIDVVYDMFW